MKERGPKFCVLNKKRISKTLIEVIKFITPPEVIYKSSTFAQAPEELSFRSMTKYLSQSQDWSWCPNYYEATTKVEPSKAHDDKGNSVDRHKHVADRGKEIVGMKVNAKIVPTI